MTQTMRHRLVKATMSHLLDYARNTDGPSTEYCAEGLLDAILAELVTDARDLDHVGARALAELLGLATRVSAKVEVV